MQYEDQHRLLDEASAVVREQAFYMKRAIENDQLREALRHASNLICELRTSLLSPKNYYDLYMQVFQELQHLSSFFNEIRRQNRRMGDLYESVQHAANILPRLYLLITVGASYIESKEAPAKEILKDVQELCKGIQHPTRGLFLRYYLSQLMKDKLPDGNLPLTPEEGGDPQNPSETGIHVSFEFILNNFVESMRLWCRISVGGGGNNANSNSKDKGKREKEKQDLVVLVGANLVRLSQLDGLTWEFYRDFALPKLLEQLLGTKDAMGQQYLLDSIIMVFPDDYHLHSLEKLLEACTSVQPGVDLRHVVVTLMKRLSKFISGKNKSNATDTAPATSITDEVNVFEIFRTKLSEFVDRPGSSMEVSDLLELEASFMTFTLALYPGRIDYVDSIFSTTETFLLRYFASQAQSGGLTDASSVLDPKSVQRAVDILSEPVGSELGLKPFGLESYRNFLSLLMPSGKTLVARKVAKIIVEKDVKFNSEEEYSQMLQYLSPLVVFMPDPIGPAAGAYGGNNMMAQEPGEEDMINDMMLFCAIIQRIDPNINELDKFYSMATSTRSCLGSGGPIRVRVALPPLIYKVLDVIPLVRKREIEIQTGVVSSSDVSNGASPGGGAAAGTVPLEQQIGPDGLPIPIENNNIDVATAVPAAASEQFQSSPPKPLQYGLKKYFGFLHTTITKAFNTDSPVLAIQCWLKGAAIANSVDAGSGAFVDIAIEFVEQALHVYEEEVKDSKDQFKCITLIVSTLIVLSNISTEQYETFSGKLTRAAIQLQKKSHQCKAIDCCSHLFWCNTRQDGSKVAECLKRCLKVAEQAAQQNPAHMVLFLETLDSYIYYIESGCPDITVPNINMLVQICREQLLEFRRRAAEYGQAGGQNDSVEDCREHFNQILKYLLSKVGSAGWAELDQSVLVMT